MLKIRLKLGLVSGTLLLASFPFAAHAQSLENCRIAASKTNIVSLGFPLRAERLANITNPKILVLPYQFKDEPTYILTDEEKAIFSRTAANISKLSHNKSNIDFVFNPTIQISTTAPELDDIKIHNEENYQKDLDNSTWGFVKKTLKENDSKVNYSGVDAIVLWGNSRNGNQEIAEAMMYTKDNELGFGNIMKSAVMNSKWWDPTKIDDNLFYPIETDEDDINNVTLLYNRWIVGTEGTLSHEIMHLYGLTDLYGSTTSPPLSLMSDLGPLGRPRISLLPYEQWVLGWLPDSSVTCINQKKELTQNPMDNRFVLDYSKGDQSLVIPNGGTSALVVDVMTYKEKTYLLYYALENDARPPIEIFSTTKTFANSLDITGYAGVGLQLKSPNLTLLVSDNNGTSVAINLIPNGVINSAESLQLINSATQKKSENALLAIAKQEADAKASAELKAKQAAEVKAAAEKVAADLKAKEEAEAKAAADKAAADLLAQQKAAAAAKAAALKKTTITCIKGKLTKKVTAVKPVCPAGYKKKA